MGKKLIIKEADFSENGFDYTKSEWSIDYRDNIAKAVSKASASVSPFVPVNYAALQGATIKKIAMKATAGTVSIMKGSALGGAFEVVDTITVTSADTLVEYDVDIPVGEGEIIAVQNTGDTGLFYYWQPNTAGVSADFWMNATKSNYSRATSGQQLMISFYTEKYIE